MIYATSLETTNNCTNIISGKRIFLFKELCNKVTSKKLSSKLPVLDYSFLQKIKRENEEIFGLERKEWNKITRVHLYHIYGTYVFSV